MKPWKIVVIPTALTLIIAAIYMFSVYKKRQNPGVVNQAQEEKLTPDDVAQLSQVEHTQRQMAERIGTKQDGLRAEAQRVLDSLHNNRLPRSAADERMGTEGRKVERHAAGFRVRGSEKTGAREIAERGVGKRRTFTCEAGASL